MSGSGESTKPLLKIKDRGRTPFGQAFIDALGIKEDSRMSFLKTELSGSDGSGGLFSQVKQRNTELVNLGPSDDEVNEFIKINTRYTREAASDYIKQIKERSIRGELNGIFDRIDNVVKVYFGDTERIAVRRFTPTIQSGYTCVPTSLHEVGKRILGDRWPYDTAEMTKNALSEATGGDFTNPSKIYALIGELFEKGFPIVSGTCTEPLSLLAGVKAGGMAIAKHESEDHVYIIEDIGKTQGGNVFFVVGNSLDGSVSEMPLIEAIEKFFLQGYGTTVIVPIRESVQ